MPTTLWNQVTNQQSYLRARKIEIENPLNGVPVMTVLMEQAFLDINGTPLGTVPAPAIALSGTQAASDPILGPLAFALNTSIENLVEAMFIAQQNANPTITSFMANNSAIDLGSSVSLAGVFTGGTGVITPGNLTMISATPLSVSPTITTTYTLTVTSSTNVIVTSNVTVTVNDFVVPVPPPPGN